MSQFHLVPQLESLLMIFLSPPIRSTVKWRYEIFKCLNHLIASVLCIHQHSAISLIPFCLSRLLSYSYRNSRTPLYRNLVVSDRPSNNARIVNLSLESGHLSASPKTAVLSPILKKPSLENEILVTCRVTWNPKVIYLIQYLSRGIQFSRASLNRALTQHKTKTLKH